MISVSRHLHASRKSLVKRPHQKSRLEWTQLGLQTENRTLTDLWLAEAEAGVFLRSSRGHLAGLERGHR